MTGRFSRVRLLSLVAGAGFLVGGCEASAPGSSAKKAPPTAADRAAHAPVPAATTDPAATTEPTAPVAEPTMPKGESPITDDLSGTPGLGGDPLQAPQSGDADDPTGAVAPPGFGENGGTALPQSGWVDAPAVEPFASNDFAPFPHELPDQPRALVSPTYRPWTSGRNLAVHGDHLFVVNTEGGNLMVLDRTTGKIERAILVGSRPEQVVVAPDGTAYVTVRHTGSLARIAPNAAIVSQVVKVGIEPYGLALSGDGVVLYVALSGEDRLIALKASDFTKLASVDTPHKPRSVVVNPLDEVFVSQQFGSAFKATLDVYTGSLVGSELALRTSNPADLAVHVDPTTGKSKAETNKPTRCVGATVNPETGAVYLTHVEAQPGSAEIAATEIDKQAQVTDTKCKTDCQTTCQNSGGYGGASCTNSCNTSCVTKVLTFPHIVRPIETTVSTYDPGASAPHPTESASPVKHPKTNEPMTSFIDQPWDVNHHPTWSLAFVVGKGTDNLLVLNTASADPMRSTLAEIKVGRAPQAVAFSDDGAFAYTLDTHDFTISEIALAPLFSMSAVAPSSAPDPGFGKSQFKSGAMLTNPIDFQRQRVTAFAVDTLVDAARLGRRTFTFARNPRLSSKGFFACATCHFEGTEDKQVWFVSDGPRQTPLLAGRVKNTAPFNWKGSAATMQENFINTVARMGGQGLQAEELASLETYISDHLVPPPNPNVSPDGLTASQKAGQVLFFHPDVGCSKCHSGETLTDGKVHDVGTSTALEKQLLGGDAEALKLNTPSLKGLFLSAPYLHDGSAKTLFEVLNLTSTTMGKTQNLTGQQRTDLVNYLLTL